MGKALFAFLLVAGFIQQTWAFDFTKEKIIFGDGRWEFLGEKFEIREVKGYDIIWGKTKVYQLKKDLQIIGMATFAFGDSEPFYKQVGKGSESLSLVRVKGKWISGTLDDPELITDEVTSLPIKIVATVKTRHGKIEFTLWNEEFPLLEDAKRIPNSETVHLP